MTLLSVFCRNTVTRKTSRQRVPSWKPRLEMLEDRTLLSVFNVDVTAPWRDTGIDVVAGQTIQMTTDPSQRVQFGFGGPFGIRTITADGIGDEGVGPGADGTQLGGTSFVLPGTVIWSLIGKIGGTTAVGSGTALPEGRPGKGAGFVGSSYSQPIQTSGRLFLGFNDEVGGFFDNAGSFAVMINRAQSPVTVQNVQVNDGSAQRSMVNSLTVTFSTIVTLDPGAFQVSHQNGDLVTANFTSSVVGNQTEAVLTFAGSEIIGGSLADGNYTLTIVADHVHDADNNTLDADRVESFYRLFGDTQGHRTVDATDVAVLFGTFGKRAGDDGFVSYLDYDGDGAIDDTDLYAFIARYGTTLDP